MNNRCGNLFCLLASCLFLTLTACAPAEKAAPIKTNDDGVFQEGPVSAEVVSREAVFTYGEQGNDNPKELILTLNSQPLLLGQSYIRLVGVVYGDRKVALVEVGGRGSVLSRGDSLCGYAVSFIQFDKIVLTKEER